MNTRSIITILLFVLCNGANSQTTYYVGASETYQSLSELDGILVPGDSIILRNEVFEDGTQFLNQANGTLTQPIVIIGESLQGPVFSGGTEAIHLVACNYIEINGLVIEGQTGNGVNIDDGGNYEVPSKGIVVKNCKFQNMAGQGNNDFLKMSGIDNFIIENCEFYNGSAGGSGIDFVGCHSGIVQDCILDNAGVSGIQAKGGSSQLLYRRNIFKNMPQRALNLGGSTGLQFFRPPLPDPIVDAYEASEIDVFTNIFIGSWAPIAYVGATQIRVRNNTIVHPENWVIRILQETTVDGFLPCSENEFSNNVIVLKNDLTEVNIGANTAPETFLFTNNLWFNESSNSWTPELPVTDNNQIIADPLLEDIDNEIFTLTMGSPAIGAGMTFENPTSDFTQTVFLEPPSIGAFEGSPEASIHSQDLGEHSLVYPNPNDGYFFVDVKNESEITIYTRNMERVQSSVCKRFSCNIDISYLPPGVYFAEIKDLRNKTREMITVIVQ